MVKSLSGEKSWWRKVRVAKSLVVNSSSDKKASGETSVTCTGLLCILRKLGKVQSLGEYNISDGFLRSLCVVSSLHMDKFTCKDLHARKISDVGMYNMVHVFPFVETFTCWEPAFDLTDMIYFCHLKQLTLLRVIFSEAVFHQLLKFFQTCTTYFHHDKHGVTMAKDTKLEFCKLEKVVLEFVLQDEFTSLVPMIDIPLEFDIGRIFQHCDNIKIFSVEFKDNILQSPPVGYSSVINKTSLKSLVYVQLGQVLIFLHLCHTVEAEKYCTLMNRFS